jgi:hypothetical protein
LLHTNFTVSPRYEALSYEWGSPTFTKALEIEGAKLPIGENLHGALVHTRLGTDCILWIDAICINQNDLAERQYQVGLMDFIYNRARRVLVWLSVPMPALKIEDYKSRPVPDGKDLDKFCAWSWTHTYWNRVWIVQEIALAKELIVCINTICHGLGTLVF